MLIQGWTTDKRRIGLELRRMQPRGGTAMYDAIAEAIPLAKSGHNPKKALVIISDGNDTSSSIDVLSVKRLIRESEVLVYAIGIDGQAETRILPIGMGQGRPRPPAMPTPFRSRCQGAVAAARRLPPDRCIRQDPAAPRHERRSGQRGCAA